MCKIRCIIVDDEPLAVEMLVNYVNRTPSLELAGSYTDPVLALSRIRDDSPDLVFMDIQMPDLNGLELSQMLPGNVKVVFTTAFKEYALDSYEVEAVDYLLKPIRYQKFLDAVTKVQRRIGGHKTDEPAFKERKSVFIKVEGEFRNIDLDDILYVSGMKDYVTIHLASARESLVTHITMKGIEDLLPSEKFMRVHRSHIVALDKITCVDSSGDISLGSVSVPVSDSYRKEVEAYIKKHLLSKKEIF